VAAVESNAPRKLRRSDRERMLSGVCGGLAEYFDLDPTIVRLAFVLTAFAGGTGLIAYIVLAIIMPMEGSDRTEPRATVRENLSDIEHTAREFGEDFRDRDRPTSEEEEEARSRRRRTAGIVLVGLGALFLLSNMGVFAFWLRWDILWPLVLVAIGVAILLGRGRR
jgi:phage shock protein C